MDRKELIEQNLGLVHACANRFRGRGIEYEELYSAGCLGLVKAADGFREELGFAFQRMPYLRFWVKSKDFSETAER